MLPSDWQLNRIDAIADVCSGGTPSRQNAEYWGAGIPWVTTAEVHFNRIQDTEQTISKAGLTNSSAKLLPPGTILLAMYGQGKTRGQVAILDIEAATNQACAAIRFRPGHSNEYYFQFLQSKYQRIRNLSNSGGQDNLSSALIKSIKVAVPPLVEQERITEILSTWDHAIETTEQLIENSKAQKKALMQQLLTGKQRLPGFSDAWSQNRLGLLCSERKESNRLDLPLLSITQSRGVIYRDNVGRKDTSSKDKTKYKRLCPDDIGYNTMRMWQGVSALSDKEGIVSPAYTVVTPNQDVHPRYMAYLFKLPKTVHDFYRHSQGLVSDTWNLKFPNFCEVKVAIPALPEQEAIAGILQSGDCEIEKLAQHLKNLRLQKTALMQQLLTGKRRVKVAA